MSIHDFHSKLMSGKDEGTLIRGLRRVRGLGRPVLASEAEPGWTYWTDPPESGTAPPPPGWTNWETEAEALSQA